ncbi:response regulator [Geotalea sp. SG265]|uniref:response regulator n=1 Tax=Geotalea sp. SG265 TaxID=2922867 RepID=UPI001FAED604|nr:response regulator [Geotalea sp. SG265]
MPKTALVVDDAGVVRQLCALTLRRVGYDVIEGINGKDALAKTEGVHLDLVITDLNMPEMDGIELVKQLRLRRESKFIPIVVLSTVSQEAKVDEGRAAGASGWIFKPFDANKLLETIKKFQ